MARSFIVKEAVIDLRNEPHIQLPNDYSHQGGRETQLLFGEKLLLLEEDGEWLKVAAVEQLRHSAEKGWHPYPGWVRRDEVLEEIFPHPTHVMCQTGPYSYGTYIHLDPSSHLEVDNSRLWRPLPLQLDREQLLKDAFQFLDAPYLWGGRSSPVKGKIASVDCSSLIHLLYRGQGVIIPRNAHDQYLASAPTSKLLPADLLYLAKEKRVTHVLLKIDNSTFMESPETGKQVRLLKWGTHIWKKDGKLHFFDRPSAYFYYPRCFLT